MCSERSGRSAATAVHELRGRLTGLNLERMDDTERLELLRAAEELTRSLAAVSVRAQVSFAESQVAEQAAAGIPARKRGLAVADDVAAARKTSPSMASRELTSAKALVSEMPMTLQALTDGTINAYQARVITEATTCLDAADRAEVDERLQSALAGASNAEIGKAVRALVYEVDPAGFVRRARKAAKDRGVSVRPAPDVMAVLSARLPAPQAIACYAALRAHAVAARASGDPRNLNQLMADELVHRLTGRTVVDGIDVEVGLVMTDAALFDGASDAADLESYGPIPAQMARDLLRQRAGDEDGGEPDADSTAGADGAESTAEADGADDTAARSPDGTDGTDGPGSTSADEDATDAPADRTHEFCPDGIRCSSWDCTKIHGTPPAASPAPREGPVDDEPAQTADGAVVAAVDGAARAARAWVRRLYVDPVTGILAGRDPRRRLFTGSLRAFLIARDRTCRNSWCGAPIRDIDHIHRHSDGGSTDADNGRGLCQRCNLARDRARHHDPPPESYRPPPPAVTTLLGRRPVGVPSRGLPDESAGAEPPVDPPVDPPPAPGQPASTEREVA